MGYICRLRKKEEHTFFDFSQIMTNWTTFEEIIRVGAVKPQAAQTHVTKKWCKLICIPQVTRELAGVALKATVENKKRFRIQKQ